MELATDISPALSFGKTLGLITHKVQEGINKKTRKISQKYFGPNFDHLLILKNCMSSLVKKPPKSSLK